MRRNKMLTTCNKMLTNIELPTRVGQTRTQRACAAASQPGRIDLAHVPDNSENDRDPEENSVRHLSTTTPTPHACSKLLQWRFPAAGGLRTSSSSRPFGVPGHPLQDPRLVYSDHGLRGHCIPTKSAGQQLRSRAAAH